MFRPTTHAFATGQCQESTAGVHDDRLGLGRGSNEDVGVVVPQRSIALQLQNVSLRGGGSGTDYHDKQHGQKEQKDCPHSNNAVDWIIQSTVIIPMDTGIYNKHLYEQLKKAFKFGFMIQIKQDVENYFCNDLDSVRYWIIASQDRLQLRFTINSFDQIWKYIEEYFRQTYFLGFQVHAIPDFDHSLEIVVDKKSLQQFSARLQIAETGKVKLYIIFDQLSKKLACIKRHFIASPFEMMLITANENHRFKGNKRLPNLAYSLRFKEKEKTWLAFEGNQFTVYFGLSFEDRFQQQNAKVYFSELADAKKHVMNAPSITLNQSELPKFLIDSFPEERKSNYSFTNGIIAVTLYGSLVKNSRTMATYLANFRSYAYYHIQASKCYLHSRLLRRIKTFQHDLDLTDTESLK